MINLQCFLYKDSGNALAMDLIFNKIISEVGAI